MQFGNALNERTNENVLRFFFHLIKNRNNYWLDIIPAYTSVTIIYDVTKVRANASNAFSYIKQEIEQALHACDWNQQLPSRKVTIPVCYHSQLGLDIARMAEEKKTSESELINLHTQRTYRVFMIGFLPGFAYMGTVDKQLATQRLAQPRTNVPAGSVGVAGEQTGIYPLDSPGGWNIVGRTPLRLFEAQRTDPVLLQPGDVVQFVSISRKEFDEFNLVDFDSVQS